MKLTSILMAANLSKADGLTPIVTFISVVVIGIVISEYILEDQSLQLPIILGSFFIGILLAALELRAIIGRKRMEARVESRPKLSEEEAKDKLARYVADLFDEDIPFDEIDAERERKLAEMNSEEIDSENIDDIEKIDLENNEDEEIPENT